MALSQSAQKSLDWALEKANQEQHMVTGFIVSPDQVDFQPFGNQSDSIDDFISNLEEAVRILKCAYQEGKEA